MAAAQTKGAAPPAPPPPPPVPVSGIQPQRRAIAPQITEEPKGQNPAKEAAERQRAAMAKLGVGEQRARDAAAGEDAAPPPKAKSSQELSAEKKPAAAPGKPTDGKTPTDGATDGKSEPGKADEKADESKNGASEREPRYTFAAMRKWTLEHPEEAAALRPLFDMPADQDGAYIALKNRDRKLRAQRQTEHDAELARVQSIRDEAVAAQKAMDDAAGKLSPIADLWEVVREPIAADPQNPKIDFEAGDAAFLSNAGISIDDYMRLRARRSIGSGSDAVKLRAENARLKRQLETKPAEEKPKEPAAEAPAAKTNGKRKEHDWSSELPGKHKLRQIDGWNALLDAEMRKYHDPDQDEYSADPEKIADGILKKQIEALTEEEEPEPPPRARKAPEPAARPKVRKPDGNGTPSAAELTPKTRKPADDDDDELPADYQARLRKALKNHERRVRGEID